MSLFSKIYLPYWLSIFVSESFVSGQLRVSPQKTVYSYANIFFFPLIFNFFLSVLNFVSIVTPWHYLHREHYNVNISRKNVRDCEKALLVKPKQIIIQDYWHSQPLSCMKQRKPERIGTICSRYIPQQVILSFQNRLLHCISV